MKCRPTCNSFTKTHESSINGARRAVILNKPQHQELAPYVLLIYENTRIIDKWRPTC
ncbi:unnamed protein product, partial [Nesidiocoris tenuis]